MLALASAVLLILSFPNFNLPVCAWVALVPWLVALRGLPPRRAFGLSWLIGFVFFPGSMWWLVHLTAFGGPWAILGWLVLCAYLALYFGAFGWFVHQQQATSDKRQGKSNFADLMFIPAAWVALEFIRTHALSGLGWNLLGYSQAPALSVIQIADITGVWGVSFLIVAVNAAIAQWLGGPGGRRAALPVAAAVALLLAAHGYGQRRLAQPPPAASLRVAVVQGNIPQAQKWDEAYQEQIVAKFERLTREAVSGRKRGHSTFSRGGLKSRMSPFIDVVIWPETSVPAVLGLDDPITARVQRLAQELTTPLIVGAPIGVLERGVWRMTNSAALIDADGEIADRYNKLRLVLFGEFIPFERALPWLRRVLPPIGDFVPGADPTVFLGKRGHSDFSHGVPHRKIRMSPFSVLICFEDTFPDLARTFVRRGATWLATITNDAWFGPTAAAYQHAQASTFRAVELRVPMVRAANTGWSGCIDALGRWQSSVRDAQGRELFVEGAVVCEVTPGDGRSLYLRFGDWFAWLCVAGCAVLTFVWFKRR